MTHDDDRGPTLGGDMVQLIVTAIVSQLDAGAMKAAVTAALSAHLGGRRVYVPLTSPAKAAAEIQQRDDAIRAAFTGANLREVCRRFGVSRATVYRAADPRRLKQARKRQASAAGPKGRR